MLKGRMRLFLDENRGYLSRKYCAFLDGNFSFSLAYSRRYPSHKVTATSVDTMEDLQDKYKEFEYILAKLSAKGCSVRVCMCIDQKHLT